MNSNISKLCPVKIWASVITRILSYPKGSTTSSINIFREKRNYNFISSKMMRESLRKTVEHLGPTNLGISPKDVGTHSIRSSFAMLLLLNKVPLEKVMKLGRWKSLSVLEYIRANVDDFSTGISKCITRASTGYFYTLPPFINSIN